MRGDESDTALVAAARGGDKTAFASLYARHQPWLLALCRRMLDDAALAEDATQEAAIQALLHLGRLRQPERFGPWLWSIGLHVCQRWRQERAHAERSWEALHAAHPGFEPMAQAAGPEALVETAEVGMRVRAAVLTLPAGQREAVLLFYLEGCSEAETASRLGIRIGAVKTRLHKARAALQRRLEDDREERDRGT